MLEIESQLRIGRYLCTFFWCRSFLINHGIPGHSKLGVENPLFVETPFGGLGVIHALGRRFALRALFW